MSNIKISQLPNWIGGNTTGSFIVMNDSGSNTTYKIRKENWLFPYSGNATITGSLNVTGSIVITGGTQTIQGSVNGVTLSSAVVTVQGNTNNRTGSFTRDDISFETNTGSLNRSILNRTSLFFGDDNGTVFMSKQSGSFLGMANSLNVTGSVNISTVMKLANQNPLPTGTVGSLAVSGSGLYFHNGTSWNLIS